MTPVQRDLARHALGLDGRRKESYRNYFVTGEGSTGWRWSRLGTRRGAQAQSSPAAMISSALRGPAPTSRWILAKA
ncbi:hypothetical protein P9228_05825 [Mesorhizobium sp. WSM4898]|uniref:hypothetical protein n=1 Tax=Mesorhizobium sp. WSM4898 TaxID=3038544 RepID=UPI002414EB61|nr:hypothetical protein [Mesorhizobium sp. WSM4898]MDG4905965.1 hypothetical protein [Mesorhizobium sp. WSM4898]